MANPNRLLKKLRTFINKNIRDILTNQPDTIIPPIPKKYLPPNSYLRDLYNQAYCSHYANMGDASLSLSCVCLERICRDFYKEFIGDDTDIGWNQILEQLIKHFDKDKDKEPNKSFLILLKDIMQIKNRIRRLLLHGKIDEFIKDTKLEHSAVNVYTGKPEKFQIEYIEKLHGKRKGEIKHKKINLMSHDTLALLTITIIKFNKHINTSKMDG